MIKRYGIRGIDDAGHLYQVYDLRWQTSMSLSFFDRELAMHIANHLNDRLEGSSAETETQKESRKEKASSIASKGERPR